MIVVPLLLTREALDGVTKQLTDTTDKLQVIAALRKLVHRFCQLCEKESPSEELIRAIGAVIAQHSHNVSRADATALLNQLTLTRHPQQMAIVAAFAHQLQLGDTVLDEVIGLLDGPSARSTASYLSSTTPRPDVAFLLLTHVAGLLDGTHGPDTTPEITVLGLHLVDAVGPSCRTAAAAIAESVLKDRVGAVALVSNNGSPQG